MATASYSATLNRARERSWVDLDTLMRIKSLEMRARVVVQGFLSGLHRSPFHGFSVEFTEYRQYSSGDDPRYIDWKLYARSDRYFVKRFEDETNLRCFLLVDQSQSMNYGSLGYSKSEYVKTLAATLAYFLNGQRDAVGLVTFDENVKDYLPARYRPGHLRRVLVALDSPTTGTSTNLVRALNRVAELATRPGLKVLISDLLAPIDALQSHLGFLRSRGHEVIVFQVLDPSEVHFEFQDPAVFHDLESGRQLYVDPTRARRQYQQRLEQHCESIKRVCQNLGADYLKVLTNQPLETALFDYLRKRYEKSLV